MCLCRMEESHALMICSRKIGSTMRLQLKATKKNKVWFVPSSDIYRFMQLSYLLPSFLGYVNFLLTKMKLEVLS